MPYEYDRLARPRKFHPHRRMRHGRALGFLGLAALLIGLLAFILFKPFQPIAQSAGGIGSSQAQTATAAASSQAVISTPSGGVGSETAATPAPGANGEQAASQAPASPTPRATLTAQGADLLYLSEGNLRRWSPSGGYDLVLAQRVAAYAPSLDGRRIVLLRSNQVAASGENQYDLAYFELKTRQIFLRLSPVEQIFHLTSSPNGRWLAYTDKETGGSVFALRLDGAEPPVNLGSCLPGSAESCSVLAWSPDNQSVAWSDERGIWVSDLIKPGARLAIASPLQILGPKGESTELAANFKLFSWSPIGRFILTYVDPSPSPVRWLGIADLRGERLEEAPGSYGIETPAAAADWDAGGLLAVAGLDAEQAGRPPHIRTYQIMPTRDNMVGLEAEFQLSGESLAAWQELAPPAGTARLAWLHLDDRQGYSIGMDLSEIDEVSPAPGAVFFRLQEGEPQFEQLGQVSFQPEEVLWAPQSAQAVVLGAGGEAIYLAAGLAHPTDLAQALQPSAHDFRWLLSPVSSP